MARRTAIKSPTAMSLTAVLSWPGGYPDNSFAGGGYPHGACVGVQGDAGQSRNRRADSKARVTSLSVFNRQLLLADHTRDSLSCQCPGSLTGDRYLVHN